MTKVPVWVPLVAAGAFFVLGLGGGFAGGRLTAPRVGVTPDGGRVVVEPVVTPPKSVAADPVPVAPPAPDRGPHTAAEWRRLVLGKKAAELTAMMGPPEDTYPLDADQIPYWHFFVKVTTPGGKVEQKYLSVKIDGWVAVRVVN